MKLKKLLLFCPVLFPVLMTERDETDSKQKSYKKTLFARKYKSNL